MKPVAILYATREGHTRRIAEHIGADLRVNGISSEVRNLRERSGSVDLTQYRAAILAASVHGGDHEPEMVEFVKESRPALEGMPAAFLSVSLSEAGAEEEGRRPRSENNSRGMCGR